MVVAQDDIDRLAPTRPPSERAIGFQCWRDLLFLHWRVSPAEMAAHIPESLSVDTFRGSAWVGIVAFRMTGVRPWWSPPLPFVSSFAETNVRTYVHFKGADPGVWFLSLDAASSLGAKLGRMKWGLPYHCAGMSVSRKGTQVRYVSERLWPGRVGAGGTFEAETGEVVSGLNREVEPGISVPGSLDHFLIERYILYSQKKGQLCQGRVHHAPYRLRETRLLRCDQSLLEAVGMHFDRPPDHVQFSDGVDTKIFPLRPVVAVR